VETPDVIDLRKPQRKEPERQTEKQLYQVELMPVFFVVFEAKLFT
jgi:hypothetical protein